jgi:prepilin-type processing-associated H-X9-DG protein
VPILPGADWSRSGGAFWHCPSDGLGTNMSFGANPMLAGAFFRSDCSSPLPGKLWQAAQSMAAVTHPARVIWAGDTNKSWKADQQRYDEVYTDWVMRTDDVLRGKSLEQAVAWYREFLTQDFTDYRGHCPYPDIYGCKGPAYRHSRHGPRSGIADMVFCDGHAKGMPIGSIHVGNVFPGL